MILPTKRFDIFPPGWGMVRRSIDDAFRFSLNTDCTGRPGSSEIPRNPLTRWDVSSIPANGIFLTKKQRNKKTNAQRVEDD